MIKISCIGYKISFIITIDMTVNILPLIPDFTPVLHKCPSQVPQYRILPSALCSAFAQVYWGDFVS